MSDDRRSPSAIERYGLRRPQEPDSATSPGDQGSQAFSVVGSNRQPAVMLELRNKTGDSTALGYAYLVQASFNPSEGIELEFTRAKVRLKGEQLRELFSALVAHRVEWIQQASGREEIRQGKAVVRAIEIEGIG